MKRFLSTSAGLVMFGVAVSSFAAMAQERYDSGPYKGFVREQPPLSTVEILKPFKVSVVRGTVVCNTVLLAGAFFEIRDSSGRVLTAITDDKGTFTIADVPPGTYDFKATKDQFQSVVGKVIVSRRAARKNTINVQLHVGT